MIRSPLLVWMLGAAVVLGSSSLLLAQDEKPAEAKTDKSAEKKKADEPKWFAVQGGDVYTGNGLMLRGASVLSKDGVIEEIGFELDLPPGCETLNVEGLRVYPGLISISASRSVTTGGGTQVREPSGDFSQDLEDGCLHLHDPNLARIDAGVQERIDALLALEVAESEIGDSYDPFGPNLVMTLGTGITTVEQSNTAVKLKRGEIDGVVMREKYMSTFSWSSSSSGKSDLRGKFAAAAKYLREYKAWEEVKQKDKEAKEPSKSGVDSKALAVLRGETKAKFVANERADLLEISRLAQEFGFRPVIEGCVEGWTVADELGRAGASAIITPRVRRDRPEELSHPAGSSIENAAILHRAGVQVAIVPATTSIDLGGITGRDLLAFTVEAGFAIRGGLSEQAALEGITIVPARLLGVDHRVGSLEVGKDCDLIVTDGDVLHYETLVQYAVVSGKVAYDKSKELYFGDIRPRIEKAAQTTVPLEAPAEVAPKADEKPAGD